MKHKNLTSASLFLALGVILHSLTPGFFGLMKPDFLCVMFFLALILTETVQEMIIITVACALLAALTTTIPGGQIANIVDKLLCGPVIFMTHRCVKKTSSLGLTLYIATWGTMLSGVLFLVTMSLLGSLPQSFSSMFLVIVVPTALLNSLLFYTIVSTSFFRNNVMGKASHS